MGEFHIVGGVISWSAYTLIGKKLLKNIEPLVAVAYPCTSGAIFLLITSWINGDFGAAKAGSGTGLACIFYFAFFGTTLGFI